MKRLGDRLRLRAVIIREEIAHYLEPIIGYNFQQRKMNELADSSREKVTYQIITIPRLFKD